MKRILSVGLCGILALSMALPALAAEQPSEIEAAGAYLRERGVYQGDGSGSLMLDKGLTRAEMAAILTRLHGEGEINPNHYTWACYFTDVPDWAKPYVGYCTANLLVAGYDASHYGPNDMVTPAMACTVVLRCCGCDDGEDSVWACGSYARAFKFLCGAADIPCFTISTDNHTWNMVYVDGHWLHVDVSLNDLTSSHSMLLRETYPNHPDRAPEQTAFLKELFVPGSTK